MNCFVPTCANSKQRTPHKVFVRIRNDLKREWCLKANVQYQKTTAMYCCEDHLKLEEDLDNYFKWKLQNRKPLLKKTATFRYQTIRDKENIENGSNISATVLPRAPNLYQLLTDQPPKIDTNMDTNMDTDDVKMEIDIEEHDVQAQAMSRGLLTEPMADVNIKTEESEENEVSISVTQEHNYAQESVNLAPDQEKATPQPAYIEPMAHVFIKTEKDVDEDIPIKQEPADGSVIQELAPDSGSDFEYDSDPQEYGIIDYEMYGDVWESDESDSDTDEFQLDGEPLEWSADFTTFRGFEEPFWKAPGAVKTDDTPLGIFDSFWNPSIVELIVKETNRFAATKSAAARVLWKKTDVDEMYIFLGILIDIMCLGTGHHEHYWNQKLFGSKMCDAMTQGRFEEILKYLHFVDNGTLPETSRGFLRKISKIQPIINHCNQTFKALYKPTKYLAIKESILMWLGNLYINRSFKYEFTRAPIKAYEVVEPKTGYLLQFKLYTCEQFDYQEPFIRYNRIPTGVILKLAENYLDAGHCFVVNNLYNDIGLARQLKARKTDLIGTLNRAKAHVPKVVKKLQRKDLKNSTGIAHHCGDVSVITMKIRDQIACRLSTYHGCDRENENIYSIATDFQRYSGTDKTEEKLVAHNCERELKLKWYVQEFRRLFKCSLHNCYIVYHDLKGTDDTALPKRGFWNAISRGLIDRHIRKIRKVEREILMKAPKQNGNVPKPSAKKRKT